jgi:hypothetical protein
MDISKLSDDPNYQKALTDVHQFEGGANNLFDILQESAVVYD